MIRFLLLAIFLLTALTFAGAQQSAPPPANEPKQSPQSGTSGTKRSTQPAEAKREMTEEEANDANIELMRQDIRAERKKIIAANMPLTETEATKFWPVYDRYIGETRKVNDNRYALIKEYAKSYQSMNDAQARSFIKKWLSLDQENTNLRLKFIPEFEKVISPKKTALLFQLDRRLGMMIELQLASHVPLVKP
jgi:hypothetical protein